MVLQLRSRFALYLAAECGCTAAFHLVQDKVDFRSGLFRHAGGAAALEAEIFRLDRIALIHSHTDQLFNVAFILEIDKCRGLWLTMSAELCFRRDLNSGIVAAAQLVGTIPLYPACFQPCVCSLLYDHFLMFLERNAETFCAEILRDQFQLVDTVLFEICKVTVQSDINTAAIARFKICTAIDKENRNDNFLITIRAGDSYSVSCVVVVRERITRKKGALHMGKRRPSGDGMVRKRDDGRWEGRIVVGHKANGDPIFRHVYAKTQRALTEKLHQSIECYQDVELTEDSRMTLSEWLDRWLAEYKDGTIRPGTLEGYRNYIENYIKPQLGGKQVSLITTQDVQRMYRRLKSGGRVREDAEGSKRLSDSTVRHIHTMLHGAMKAAVQAHIIPKNPTENATVPKSNYKPMQVLNEQELDTFLQAVQKDDIWRDFFYTELMTGLRRGEICALMWRDFDAKARTLKISRTLHSKGQGIYALGDTKTSQGNRTIILPESVAALLRARKKASISQWIFPQPTSPELPMNPGTAYRRLKTLLEEAGLPSIRFHDLRHTFATHALTSGVDAKTLAGILGHTNASFTLDTYTHVTPDMREAAGGIVGGFMEDLFGKELKPWQRSEKQATD